eukprot:gene54653-56425_t
MTIPPLVCAATVVWVIARSVEDGVPYGLWDSVPWADRYHAFIAPPKGASVGMSVIIVRVMVFI